MVENVVDQDKSLTLHICTGLLAADEIEQAIRSLYENGPTDNHIWDLTQADLSSIESTEIGKLSQIPAEVAPGRKGRKTAIVAGADLEYGLSRMFHAQSAIKGLNAEMKIVRTLEEANRWVESD